jgi:hypothetical protein
MQKGKVLLFVALLRAFRRTSSKLEHTLTILITRPGRQQQDSKGALGGGAAAALLLSAAAWHGLHKTHQTLTVYAHRTAKPPLGTPRKIGQGCKFHSFTTNTYKMHFLESPSGIKVGQSAALCTRQV